MLMDESGDEIKYRLARLTAEEGFLVQARIESARDYAAFAQGQPGRRIKSIRVEAGSSRGERYWQGLRVRLSAVPGVTQRGE